MKSKMGGVALAAVVGACALGGAIQKAEASAMVSGSYAGQQDIGGGIAVSQGTFSFDTATGYLDYTLYQRLDLYLIDPPQDIETTTSGSVKAYNYSFSSLGYQYGYQTYEVQFSTSVMSGHVQAIFDNGIYIPVYYNSFVGDALTGVGDTLQYVSFGVTVPLPASAPMFGAALLVLGGAACARRRFGLKAA